MFSRQPLLLLALLLFAGVVAAAEPRRTRFGDPLPDDAVARLGSAGLRDEQYPSQAAFSADGKTLRTTNGDSVVAWDVAAGKRLRRATLKRPSGFVTFRFTPDGKTLLASGFDGVIRFFDTDTGAEQKTLTSPRRDFVRGLAMARDGKTLLAITNRTYLDVWDVDAGTPRHLIEDTERLPRLSAEQVVLTPDGKHVVLPDKDGSLRVRESATGKEVRKIEAPPARPDGQGADVALRLVLSPDGRYLAVSYYAASMIVYELATGRRACQLGDDLNSFVINGMAFTPNGRFLAISSLQDTRLYGVLSGKELRRLPTPPGRSRSLLFAPDGRTLAVVGPDFVVHLWDAVAGRELHPPDGHTTAVQSLVFLGDGRRLASWANYGHLLVWDVPAGREIARRDEPIDRHSLTLAEDGRSLCFLAYPSPGWTVQRWNPISDRRDESSLIYPKLSNVRVPLLAPDGRRAALLDDGKIYLLDVKSTTPRLLAQMPPTHTVLDFTPDGRLLLTGDFTDRTYLLWDCSRGYAVHQLKLIPSNGGLPLLTRRDFFAADGRSLAVLSGGHLRLHEIATGGDRLTLAVSGVTALAVSPDGRLLAHGRQDGTVVVHGTGTGNELMARHGAQGSISALAFSRDGRLLASGGASGAILVWKVPDGEGLPATLKAEDADALWQALTDLDAARAGRALAALAAAPAQAVPLITERFRAPRKRTPEEIARLIAELDADAFKVRERASRALSEAGPDAAEALRNALADKPSAEVKRRIDDLLNRLRKSGNPERLRCLRAIEILERIGTLQALSALRELTRKELPVDLADEMQASLRRIEDRQPRTSERTRTP